MVYFFNVNSVARSPLVASKCWQNFMQVTSLSIICFKYLTDKILILRHFQYWTKIYKQWNFILYIDKKLCTKSTGYFLFPAHTHRNLTYGLQSLPEIVFLQHTADESGLDCRWSSNSHTCNAARHFPVTQYFI